MSTSLHLVLALVAFSTRARADCYLNNPRGSNNKLSEQTNNAQNQNRLFDSQNNAQAGYQIGDKCEPVCQDENRNYDETKKGAMEGQMYYYQGSELYIEWLLQHGCGYSHPNLRCQIILQYMCDDENEELRDGKKRGKQNTAGGQSEPPNAAQAGAADLGQHEPLEFYQNCRARERNKGLYTADQKVNNNRGATATRQNPNGNDANNRHGLECPEERDYYPYWHPTPWRDIAILTDDPSRCSYYQAESQNVKSKGYCTEPAANNRASCDEAGGRWKEQPPWHLPAPECRGGVQSRDNHNGNVRNGHPYYYLWEVPFTRGTCVLRIRYNITTLDFDADSVQQRKRLAELRKQLSGSNKAKKEQINEKIRLLTEDPFFIDSSFNGKQNAIINQDPKDDFLNIGHKLQLQVNTNQYGRTFQDRTHTFRIEPLPLHMTLLQPRVVNLNVRGRRGNIVQVYPSVEYDFVPQDLVVEKGTYLHFQWTGSDANPKGNQGNGRQGTDRSNLVQLLDRGENVPIPFENQTLFKSKETATFFAHLDQDSLVNCNDNDNNAQSTQNCKQLNGASAYFDGGLVKMERVGTHHIGSTRNNDFTNRSHKSHIMVTYIQLTWWELVLLALLGLLLLYFLLDFFAACYAYRHPGSWLFGRKHRPYTLSRCPRCFKPEVILEREEERRVLQREERRRLAELDTGSDNELAVSWGSKEGKCKRCCKWLAGLVGLQEMRMFKLIFFVFNACVYLIGFFTNFYGPEATNDNHAWWHSWGYPIAKGFGFVLDMEFALVVLPTMEIIQTMLRSVGATRQWLPIDDPIGVHIVCATYIAIASLGHILGHGINMYHIWSGPVLQRDPLGLLDLDLHWQASGSTLLVMFFDPGTRCAAFTGLLILALMAAMYYTALPGVRRGTWKWAKRMGGYNLFWKVHMYWPGVFLLLLLHAPQRLWIWLFFPALLCAIDRMMANNVNKYYAALRKAKLLPHDVLSLTFALPEGFRYTAGQYVYLSWGKEWHPFTLTSAPEEDHLSVHIRASSELDWCSALRRRLIEEAPAELWRKAKDSPKPGSVVHYMKAQSPIFNKFYCKPEKVGQEKGGYVGAIVTKSQEPEHVAVDRAPLQHAGTLDSLSDARLPEDAVPLKIRGPHGAPAQKVWLFDVIMVVGSGIGITPFISILRSTQIRAQQRQAIIEKAPRDVNPKLLSRTIPVPAKIYFYWIVRNQEEFNWFLELLTAAVQGPAQSIIDITLFATKDVESSGASGIKCKFNKFTGRPNWDKIFKEVDEQNQGQHVGVFLCGNPAIGEELQKQCQLHTDILLNDGVASTDVRGTQFSFFSEHF